MRMTQACDDLLTCACSLSRRLRIPLRRSKSTIVNWQGQTRRESLLSRWFVRYIKPRKFPTHAIGRKKEQMLSSTIRLSGTLSIVSLLLFAERQINVSAGADAIPTPEKFLGFRVGEDKKLARWDKIVEYLRIVSNGSDRLRFRELGKSTNNNPFILLEISSAQTLQDLDRYKELERKLYFQSGAPTDSDRDEIFHSGKAVVLVTCNIHSTEIGSSQMVLELVHRLATEDSPLVKKILDNVIFLLVPSLNPDGQIIVTDWYNKNLGTEYE